MKKGGNKETTNNSENLGRILKQQRIVIPLTLQELATISGISSSHLGRIERGERFPSASVLRKMSNPLGFEEGELFCLAGYLSSPSVGIEKAKAGFSGRQLDPYVSEILNQESVAVQRTVIGILSIFKSIAKVTEGTSNIYQGTKGE